MNDAGASFAGELGTGGNVGAFGSVVAERLVLSSVLGRPGTSVGGTSVTPCGGTNEI